MLSYLYVGVISCLHHLMVHWSGLSTAGYMATVAVDIDLLHLTATDSENYSPLARHINYRLLIFSSAWIFKVLQCCSKLVKMLFECQTAWFRVRYLTFFIFKIMVKAMALKYQLNHKITLIVHVFSKNSENKTIILSNRFDLRLTWFPLVFGLLGKFVAELHQSWALNKYACC